MPCVEERRLPGRIITDSSQFLSALGASPFSRAAPHRRMSPSGSPEIENLVPQICYALLTLRNKLTFTTAL